MNRVIIQAGWLFPIDQPPIQDGVIICEDDTICWIGPRTNFPSNFKNIPHTSHYELQGYSLFPGFVNAHCHSELTALKNLEYPGNFSGWIEKIVSAQQQLTPTQIDQGITEALESMICSGITTVADHVSSIETIQRLNQSRLRGRVFIEVLGITSERAELSWKKAQAFCEKQKNVSHWSISPSPHSAHTLPLIFLKQIFQQSFPLFSIHLAESLEEAHLFNQKPSPLKNLLEQWGGSSADLERMQKSGSAVQYLNNQGLFKRIEQHNPRRLPRGKLANRDIISMPFEDSPPLAAGSFNAQILVVHGNYTTSDDWDLLAANGISIVHCPLSHAYFGHQRIPLTEWKKRKINLAFGTDSLASGNSLSFLDQLRHFKQEFPECSHETILEMATLNGARALKLESTVGSLTPGKKADLIGFKTPMCQNPTIVLEKIFEKEKIDWRMMDGKIEA